MRKIFVTLIAVLAGVMFLSQAIAGERYYRERRGDNNEAVAAILGLAAGVIIGKALNDRGRSYEPRYYREESRPRRHSGWTGRRLRGYDEPVSSGDYCPFRLEYDEYDGRYYCVR